MSSKRQSISNLGLVLGVGLAAAVGQLAFIRLTAQSFSGNEITICIAIGHWLFWTGIGSILGSYLIRRYDASKLLFGLLVVYSITLLNSAYLLLLIRRLFSVELSEIIGLGRIFIWTGILFILPSVLNGMFFPLLVSRIVAKKLPFPVHQVYICEMLGSAMGGLAFLGLVLSGLNTIVILQLVTGLLLLIGGFTFLNKMRWKILIGGFVIVLELASAGFLLPRVIAYKWKPYQLLECRESPHQLITKLAYGGGSSIFSNNEPVWTFNIEENAEEMVHFGMLNHPAPYHVLIIGIANDDIFDQLIKYPLLESITVVQNDRILSEMLQGDEAPNYILPVNIDVIIDDPIRYLKQSAHCFDVVFMNIPLPVNAMWNVYYSQEFLRLLKEQLDDMAIVEMQFPGSETYFCDEHLAFFKIMENTAASVFDHTIWIPGETVHLLASDCELTNRLEHYSFELGFRGVENLYIRDNYLQDRLSEWRIEFLKKQVLACTNNQVNTIQKPMAYFYSTILWDQHTGGPIKLVYKFLKGIKPRFILGGAGLVLIILIVLFRLYQKTASIIKLNMALIGFCIMSLESVIIISMQSYVGALYLRITLLTTAFMLGASAGALWQKDQQVKSPYAQLTGSMMVLLLAAATYLILLFTCSMVLSFPIIHYGILMIVGFAGGIIFPVLSRLLEQEKSTGPASASGSIYAWDIIGSCLGIYLTSGLIIPVFGLRSGVVLIVVVLSVLCGSTLFPVGIDA